MPTVPHLTEFTHCGTGVLTVLWTGALIASATYGLLIYSIASFRNTPDSSSASMVRRTAMEVAWAIIPILILIGTATPSVKALVIAQRSCSSVPEAVHLR